MENSRGQSEGITNHLAPKQEMADDAAYAVKLPLTRVPSPRPAAPRIASPFPPLLPPSSRPSPLISRGPPPQLMPAQGSAGLHAG